MNDDDARLRGEGLSDSHELVPRESRGLSTSLAPASFRPRSHPPSETGRDVAGEDFLFHLYRGSELLQDSRVHEAKEELEQALHLQPRDPKGQDLLAVVYFKLGLYPRAIQIYETLKQETDQPSLRINLALCYLKTGQAAAARLELEDVVRGSPEHRRAWGYLGLAYERLGDFDKAESAFTRGGHTSMAKKIRDRRDQIVPPLADENVDPAESTAIREAAAEAFQELDAGELSFALAEPATSRRDQGTWRAIEHGQIARTSTRNSDAPPRSLTNPNIASTLTAPPAPIAEALRIESMVGVPRMSGALPQIQNIQNIEGPIFTEMTPPRSSPPLMISRPTSAPPTAEIPLLSELARGVRIGSRTALGDTVVVDASGLVVLRLRSPLTGTEEAAQEFAVRFDALRAYTGAFQTTSLERRGRGAATSETFGGIATPLVSVRGEGDLVFGPRASRQLNVCTLRDDVLFLREDTLVLFDLALTYENGRLPRTDEEPLPMVQLRGSGSVAFDVIERLRTIDVTTARPATIRGQSVVGWMGRILPRAIPVAEAPAGQRGLLGFAGEGTVFMVGK